MSDPVEKVMGGVALLFALTILLGVLAHLVK